MYPEHKDEPITISDYVEKLNKIIRELKGKCSAPMPV